MIIARWMCGWGIELAKRVTNGIRHMNGPSNETYLKFWENDF